MGLNRFDCTCFCYICDFRWCRLLRVQKVKGVVVLEMDSVSSSDYTKYPDCFPKVKEHFEMVRKKEFLRTPPF